MESLLDWGIEIILWLQQFSPALDGVFKGITFIGEEVFFMVLLPLLYWCVDRVNGIRLSLLYLFSTWINSVIKIIADQPRPFEYDSRVLKLDDPGGRGFPSGHTQSAVVVWGWLAQTYRKRWMWVLGIIFMILMPLSRLYLGVHFPTDLLGSYVLGALLLLAFFKFSPAIENWLGRLPFLAQCGLAVAVSLFMFIARPGPDEGIASVSGLIMGAGIGIAMERRWVRFDTRGKWWHIALRLLLGVAGLMAIRYGLKAAFSTLEPVMFFRMIRYAVMGFWFAFIAPWIFVSLKLAKGKI